MIYIYILTLILLPLYPLAQELPDKEKNSIIQLKENLEKYKQASNNSKLAETHNKIAQIYLDNYLYKKAAKHFQESLNLNKKIGNKNAEAAICNYLGSIYSTLSKHKEALKYFQNNLKICKRQSSKYKLALSYVQVAQAQKELKQYDRALRNLSSANEIGNELYNLELIKTIALKFIEIYKIKGNDEKEAEYFQKYSAYDKFLRTKESENKLEENKKFLDQVLSKHSETEKALSLSEKELEAQDALIVLKSDSLRVQSDSLKLAKKITEEQKLQLELDQLEIKQQNTKLEKDKMVKTFSFVIIGIGVLFFIFLLFAFKQKQKANQLLSKRNIRIKRQTLILEKQNLELKKLSLVAAKTDNAIVIMDAKGNFEWVNESFTRIFGRTFKELVNSTPNIISESTSPKVVQIINRCIANKETVYYDLSVKSSEDEDTTVHVTLTPVLNIEGEIDKIIAVDSDITLIRKANRQIKEQHKILEEQNEHITSSINYAKTIQAASLPSPSGYEKNFQTFLIYKPKDIVSGDYYWFHNLSKDEDNFDRFIISVIDSTGHGVPGAFMSLIGTQILNEIIISHKNINPAVIIEKLDKKIISALSQETTANKDGMDLVMTLVEKQENNEIKITFAGAKRPLYVFREEANELETLRGSRRSVGGIKKTVREVEFKNTTTTLSKGDSIYLTSDGLVDQPNSQRTRYGSTQLTAILQAIGKLDMKEQKEKLLESYTSHTQETPQRDDITVMGIKFC